MSSVRLGGVVPIPADGMVPMPADGVVPMRVGAAVSARAGAVVLARAGAVVLAPAGAVVPVRAGAVVPVPAGAVVSVQADAAVAVRTGFRNIVSNGRPPAPEPSMVDEDDAEAERFFAQGEAVPVEADSLAPSTADEEDWGGLPLRSVTPELLRRRVRLRRWVAIGLSSGIALLITGIGAARLGRSRSRVTPHQTASNGFYVTTRRHATPPSPAPRARASTSASAAPSEAPAPSAVEPPAAASVDGTSNDSASRLASKSRALLQAGRTRDGVAIARAAIARDPDLAEGYVLLAAGLEDLGDWREAHRTFATCAERTRSAECRYFARRTR
jgi:hypothetical protein